MSALGDFLALILSSLAPILVAAIGGMFAERARATNIAIDGTMLMAALAALVVGAGTGNPWLGLLAAVVAGTLYSLLVAFAAFVLRCDLIIAGIAINLLATGLAYLIVQNVLGSPGTYQPDGAPLMPRTGILEAIPLIGPTLARVSMITWITFVLTALAVVVMKRTAFGVRVRAVGESEDAAAAAGIRPVLIKTAAIAISGGFAGVGGAYLSTSSVGAFNPLLTGGIGFIAFAAVIFGRATPLGTISASVVFAFFTTAAIFLQGTGVIDARLLSALPYAATIAGLAFASIRRYRTERFAPVETSYLPAIIPRG